MRAVFATAITAFAAVSLYGCGDSDTTTMAPEPATMTIAELAAADPQLSTLADLLSTHGLVDTLNGTGPFTVFAPTNDAFDAAADVIATLTDDQITDVLLYHVVGAQANAADLSEGEVFTTLFDTPNHNLTVTSLDPVVVIHPESSGAADAEVTTADIMATNGVIHKVSAVLVPTLPAAGSTTAAPGSSTPAPAPGSSTPAPAPGSSTTAAPGTTAPGSTAPGTTAPGTTASGAPVTTMAATTTPASMELSV